MAAATVLILGSAGLGYGWHGFQLRPFAAAAPGARETVPAAEYFSHPRSFSELENAKADLDATALRVLFELRMRRVATQRSMPVEGSAPDAELERIVELLEQSAADLRGTEWELFVIRDLLVALKQAGHRQRWLDLYLDTLYRLPTSEVPSVFAAEALAMARALGRDEEVIRALHFILANPQASAGHDRVRRLFLTAAPGSDPDESVDSPNPPPPPRPRRAQP